MRVTVRPGGEIGGEVRVPGDKSIAHRWLILAATAEGRSELRGLPGALDVRSTARVLASIAPGSVAAELDGWASQPPATPEAHGSTSNKPEPRSGSIDLEAQGRGGLHPSPAPLDCGNSGTSMRLVAGVLASGDFESTLVGDESLSVRPMERVAAPLREMGAEVLTQEGHPPVFVRGGRLRGIRHTPAAPSAQVKGAVLLAGVAAEGETTVEERAATRDHTERALAHLGAPVRVAARTVTVNAFRHAGFAGDVPGDISSAAFLVVGAALTGRELVVHDVGLNPSRTHLLEVLGRMGVVVVATVEREEVGEPVGRLEVHAAGDLVGTTVTAEELPLLIDEIPALAMLAAHARGESWFEGAGELRVKESDRLGGLAAAILALGGHARVEGDDLVLAGGGLTGGVASSGGDHRLAMALAIGGIRAAGPVTIERMEASEVSFPGFVDTLVALGVGVER